MSTIPSKKYSVFLISDSPAHYEASINKIAPVLHRDISGGNMLIFPKAMDVKGGRCLAWTGLLCDWEMAKSTMRDTEMLMIPRQPERTVSPGLALK